MSMTMRNENEKDYRIVEELTREAFWNHYIPGCVEHYVLHNLRKSKDFIPELDFVAEIDGQIVGNIVYSRGVIMNNQGVEHKIICFGPVSVLPRLQKQGIGSALIINTLKAARLMDYPAVCIYGDPRCYSRFGFRCAEKYDIKTSDDKFAVALQVLELKPDVLNNLSGRFVETEAFHFDEDQFAEFDATFEYKEKAETDSQKEFKILASLRY